MNYKKAVCLLLGLLALLPLIACVSPAVQEQDSAGSACALSSASQISSAGSSQSSTITSGAVSSLSESSQGTQSGSNPQSNEKTESGTTQTSSHSSQAGGGSKSAETSSAQGKTVTVTIRCDNAVKNWDNLPAALQNEQFVPRDGEILAKTTVSLIEGDTAFDVLERICRQKRIHMEYTGNKVYNSQYIRGINNLYEFDCGTLSGWMYSINGWFPNYGSSGARLKDKDVVEWHYTCDLGKDLGGSVY